MAGQASSSPRRRPRGSGGRSGRHVAYIGLGSNLGPREKNITAALNALHRTAGIEVDAASSLYETEPMGGPPGQPKFLNAAARLRTRLGPRQVLHVLMQIERSLDRRRAERWGPRTIDLDLLLYDDLVLGEEDLTVPHPLMHERRFVLEPLAEIAPDVLHPTLLATARALLESLGRPADEE